MKIKVTTIIEGKMIMEKYDIPENICLQNLERDENKPPIFARWHKLSNRERIDMSYDIHSCMYVDSKHNQSLKPEEYIKMADIEPYYTCVQDTTKTLNRTLKTASVEEETKKTGTTEDDAFSSKL